jgi:glycine/D-amino acid oxidase-like deaminating enzyme
MMWNTDDPYLYICAADGNRIAVGGRDESFTDLKTLQTHLNKKAALLENDFKKLFPSIPFKKEFSWSGVFGKTRDSLPYIGSYSKTPRTFYALGFGGNGITFSLVAAEIITDLLRGKKNKDIELFLFPGDYITFTFTKSGFFANCRVYLKRILVLNSNRQYSLKKFFCGKK